MPPRVSPSFRASSTSATMRADVSASKQRSGSASSASTSSGVGSTAVLGHAHRADREGVADEADAELGEERARDRAEGDAGGGLAGARALEDRAGLVEVVLLHADEVGMTGTRARQRRTATARLVGELDGLGGHHLDPLGPLGVADAQGDRAAEADAVADAAGDREFVLLELHPRAAAVAELAAGEVGLDVGREIGTPEGRPSMTATSSGPCDSPAVSTRSIASSLPRPPGASRRGRRFVRSAASGSPVTKTRICRTAWCSSIPSPETAVSTAGLPRLREARRPRAVDHVEQPAARASGSVDRRCERVPPGRVAIDSVTGDVLRGQRHPPSP